MKKTIFMGLAALAALGFTSCNDSNCSSKGAKDDNDKVVLYSGIMPAADAQGTVYTLKLDYDDDNNFTDGDFTMTENTMVTDTVAPTGFKQVATSFSEGDFKKESKQVDGATVEYIRLVPDAKDALGTPSSNSSYFLINSDGSLTMVDANLQKPEMPENYTLAVK